MAPPFDRSCGTCFKSQTAKAVIASEAKQSIKPRKGSNPSSRAKKEWIASLRSQ
jgi:hypothetical protein